MGVVVSLFSNRSRFADTALYGSQFFAVFILGPGGSYFRCRVVCTNPPQYSSFDCLFENKLLTSSALCMTVYQPLRAQRYYNEKKTTSASL